VELLEAGPALTDRELSAIVKLVYEKSGITLHDGKRSLVTARLQKRLRAGGFRSFSSYLAHVEADASGEELTLLLDAIATNHTSFFREPQHFAFLRERVLPGYAEPTAGRLSIWSAACSSGEEPYTLAMELKDHLPAAAMNQARILASDLSTKVLATARGGVYRLDRVGGLPVEVLRRHFEKGLGAQEGLARVAAHARQNVEFRQLNLLEINSLGEAFDVIFCRNVMIYFDKQVQQRVVSMLERHLAPRGYLFISHSESLNGIEHGLRWVAPAVYQRQSS
jgi:chemotaxis protein methyltransferase CheR